MVLRIDHIIFAVLVRWLLPGQVVYVEVPKGDFGSTAGCQSSPRIGRNICLVVHRFPGLRHSSEMSPRISE